MGKRKKKPWNDDKFQKKRRNNPSWKDIIKENTSMETYYKKQGIVAEEEWDEFMMFARKDLPSTFRITKIRGNAEELLFCLKDGYINKIAESDIKDIIPSEKNDENPENELDLLLEPIAWYPDELAWNFNLSRRFIRRSDILQRLHRFLVEDSECGAITRQEAVSMIPPMFLDVKPHHVVLDMCAAPGSKTVQIIEMLHANHKTKVPTGAVIANDVTQKRCYMLTHQAKRLNTPCVVITNYDAKVFPKMTIKNNGVDEALKFDRILCDVPCSGDGTLRKNPLIWTRWNPQMAIGLHKLQNLILTRGLELLKIGGRLVYSTCSFNPIENEAILATMLLKTGDSVELVDCTEELPKLKRKPGLNSWKVFDKDSNEYCSFEEVNTSAIHPTMFPPSSDVLHKLNLQRCMRVYPHMQNTGGFFIAVLHKKKELPWIKTKSVSDIKFQSAASNEEGPHNKGDKNEKDDQFEREREDSEIEIENTFKRKFKRGMVTQDPYIFLDDTDADLIAIRDFYNISSTLPSKQLLVRSSLTGKKRHIYFVSKSVQQIMNSNKNLKVINTGVRIVTRSSLSAGQESHGIEFRLVQEGIFLMKNYISKRIIDITFDDLVKLLSTQELPLDELNDSTKASLEQSYMGCIVWLFKAENSNLVSTDMWFCGHQGKKVVQMMLSKDECKHYLRLICAPIPAHLEIKEKGPSWDDSKIKSVGDKSQS